MSSEPSDVHPDVLRLQIDLLRETPVWRKLEMVGELNKTMHILMMAGLRNRHPDASPEELRRRMADLLLGPELAEKVYGPLITSDDHVD